MTTALQLRLPALHELQLFSDLCLTSNPPRTRAERLLHAHLFVSIRALVLIFKMNTYTSPHRTACTLFSILSVPNCERYPHKFCLLAFGLHTSAGTTLFKSPWLNHARVLAFVMPSSSL
jgi:hypothetical protein